VNMLRVFLADDHAVLREGLRALVNSQTDMECVGEAADGRAAVERVQSLRPDVAVLDVSMPGLNGLEAAKKCGSSRSRDTQTTDTSNNS
jgi:two-component system response regulator NreC